MFGYPWFLASVDHFKNKLFALFRPRPALQHCHILWPSPLGCAEPDFFISDMIRMRHVGGWIVNESCCRPREESDRLDRADGRGWWTERLWHTSLSAGRIQLIINAFQLVANKSEAGGQPALLSREKRRGKLENKYGLMNACAHVSMPTTVWAHTHTRTHTQLTYNSELCIGVDLAVLVTSHALVHSCVGKGQATDWQCSIGDLYALLWT